MKLPVSGTLFGWVPHESAQATGFRAVAMA